jgi:hypothetical protein
VGVARINAVRAAPTLQGGSLQDETCLNSCQIAGLVAHRLSTALTLIIWNMPKIQMQQALTEWGGDTASLIDEMKRRAGVRTDRDLASFLGVAQSTVSHWRVRGQVPMPSLLRFERMLESGGGGAALRSIAARMVAIRLAEFWYERSKVAGATGGRDLIYFSVAACFPIICDAIMEHLQKYESATGKDPVAAGEDVMRDEEYLKRLRKWVSELPVHAARL